MSTSKPDSDSGLIRAMGVPALTANVVNTTIGASIFALPAVIATRLGAAAPAAFVVCALAMMLFVTCFALAGSRVSLTGGLYAYAEVAFGRYVGFIAALLYYTTAVLAVAAVVNVFADSLGGLVPALAGRPAHIAIVFIAFAVLAATNIRGVREGASAVTVVTVVKLLPLLVFVVAGVFFIKPAAIAWPGFPGAKPLGDAVLLLLFAFVGVEVALMPSGEVKNPARTVPRAIYAALAITTVLYILIQLVAQGTLGAELASSSTTPLADAAARFLGKFGRVLLLGGAMVSSFGFVASDVLSSPRILFALGRDGMLPAAFARVHPRFHTPHISIAVYAAVSFLFSLTSSFEQLAVMSNVAALLLYLIACGAAWRLIGMNVRADGAPLRFPGAGLFPPAAILAILWLLVASALSDSSIGSETRSGLKITGAFVVVGSVLFVLRTTLARRKGPS